MIFKCKKKLNDAEYVLKKIAAGRPGDWQTTAALRYFGWSWDKDGHAIPPGGKE
jgi:hypothetical protein